MSLLGPKGAWAELQRRHAGQVEWSGSPKAGCLVSSTVCLLGVWPWACHLPSSRAAGRFKEGDLGWVRAS